jgi:hypothetical protein
MTRLIDADKLKEELQKHHDFFIEAWKENGVDKIEIPIPDKSRMDEITNCIAMVVNAPTVTINPNDIEYKAYCKGLEDGKKIARPHGKWIKIFENPFTNGYVCPFCGHKIQVTEQFLPKVTECEVCGARMDGGEE